MALLDMSDVITDPDFADSGIGLERDVQTVGADGMATNAPSTSGTFSGVVCAADGSRMTRNDSGEMVESNITIHTLVRLTAGKAGSVPADVVTWKGARYTVVNVNDYSHFGAGFVAATCDLIPVAGD